jgi:hypothetical protein
MTRSHPILRYLYDSWIQTCGAGWTTRQVFAGYVFSILLALGVLLAAALKGLDWSWLQMVAAGLLAWDLFGGAIGYNHPAMKRRRWRETSRIAVWHHNLQHIHPLLLIFFDQSMWLLGLTLYWFITFFLYVEFLEIVPASGERRLDETAQKWVIGFEIAAALALVGLSFVVDGIPADFRLYGMIVYGGLILATFIVQRTPLVFQRTMATIALATMITLGLFLAPPPGFQWLLPIYFLKLLVGFTAKEHVEKINNV